MQLCNRSRKHKKKSSNIMLLVLFVMFVSSLLGLLVSYYIQNLIRISLLFQHYHRTYYYAYAGMELGLTQVKNHGFGYEEGQTFEDFSYCTSASGCSFTLDIDSRRHILHDAYDTSWTSCTGQTIDGVEWQESMYELVEGDAWIVPLFWDVTTGFNFDVDDEDSYDIIDDATLQNMNPELVNYCQGGCLGTGSVYTIRVIDEELENYNTTLEPDIEQPNPFQFSSSLSGFASSDTNKNYLIIANPGDSSDGNSNDDDKLFCLELDAGQEDLPSKYVLITSVATQGTSIVSLGAIKTNQLPSYLVYGTIEE